MFEIDREAFGAFLVQLRKEKGLTQKELAEKLYVSDKAVSKWERGLSLPDISLLTPLAEILGVTVTELLRGERLGAESLPVEQVEELVTGSLELSGAQRQQKREGRRQRGLLFALSAAMAMVELLILWRLGFSWAVLWNDLGTVEGLCLLFGGWACLFAPDVLPAYYDQNNISSFSSGPFRLNLAGVRISNRNWPYLMGAARWWLLVTPVVFPLLYLAILCFAPVLWEAGKLWLTLIAALGLFVPMIVAGKLHE